MDHSRALNGSVQGRKPSSPASSTPTGSKGQAAQSGLSPRVTITPFHSSPIVSGEAALRSKQLGAAPGKPLSSGCLFLGKPGFLTAASIRERPAALAAERQSPSLNSAEAAAEKAQGSLPVVKVN